MRKQLTVLAKKALAPLVYRHKPIGLSAGKLYLYLDAIYRTRALDGAVVEIGCNVCGTSALGHQMLRKLGSARRYLCIDTFSGFVEGQHADDVERGNPGNRRLAFANNDMDLARKVLEMHGADAVELLQADVCTLPAERLPAKVSVCLNDVDLYQPILASLEKIYPRMQPGGVILIDDCSDTPRTWRAGDALRDFCQAHGVASRLEFGMGVIEIAGGAAA